MEIFKQIDPLRAFLKTHRAAGKSIGLVPTMGALHAGHLSLINVCKAQNGITVATIYVNPTQFNNLSDLEKYPRTLESDVHLLESVGCEVLFCPDNAEMYPEKSVVTVDFGSLDKVMEGKFRPGHFSGVALVVSKLFNIIQPDHAYFGQKDFQQFAVIQKLVDELKFDLTLHRVPTSREPDGLAMSSRNLRLNSAQREHAIVFYQALTEANHHLRAGMRMKDVQALVKKKVENHPEIKLEYLELADSKNLNLLESVESENQPVLCIAGFIGDVRLIDNLLLDQTS